MSLAKNLENCVLGVTGRGEIIDKWNLITLWARFFIHKNRVEGFKPNFAAFRSCVKSKLKILEYVVSRNQKDMLSAFKEKWKEWR